MSVDKEKNAQFLLTVPKDLLSDIEDYWHKNGFKNRNAAIRDLIRKGLDKRMAVQND